MVGSNMLSSIPFLSLVVTLYVVLLQESYLDWQSGIVRTVWSSAKSLFLTEYASKSVNTTWYSNDSKANQSINQLMSVESSGLHNLTRTKCWKKIFLSSGSRVRFCNRPYIFNDRIAWEYVLTQLRQKDQLLSVLPQFVQNKDVYFIISQGYDSEVLLLCHAQHTSKDGQNSIFAFLPFLLPWYLKMMQQRYQLGFQPDFLERQKKSERVSY